MALLWCATILAADKKKDLPPIEIAATNLGRKVDFEKDVLPIFRQSCLACHNASEAESDLVMETPATILKGGGEGPAVVAGQSAKSLLLKMAARQMKPYMPPPDNDVSAKQLTPKQLGIIKQWIDEGATGEVKGSSGPLKWQPLPPGVNPIYAVAISPDGQYAVCGRANQIFVYHIPSGRELGRLTDPDLIKTGIYKNPGVAHLDMVQSLAFSPDGQYLASGGFRTVKIWRRPRNVQHAALDVGDAKVAALSRDGKLGATGDATGAIKIWDVASKKTIKTLSGHSGAVTGIAFSADGSKLVSGSADKTLRAWDVQGGKLLGKIDGPVESKAVALVMGETQIASGDADNMVRIWPLPGSPVIADPAKKEGEKKEGDKKEVAATGPKPLKELKGHTGPITSMVVVGNDGKALLTGSVDGTVRHWNVEAGSQLRQMNHGGPVAGVATSGDGKRFASAGANKVAKLYNGADGKEISQLKGDYRAYARVAMLTRTIALAKAKVADKKNDVKKAEARKKSEEDQSKKADAAKKKADEDLKKKTEAAKVPVAAQVAAKKKVTEAEAKDKAAEAKKAAADKVAKAKKDDKPAKDALAVATREAQQAAQQLKQAKDKLKAAGAPADKAKAEQTASKRALEAANRSIKALAEAVKKATAAIPVAQKTVKDAEAEVAAFEAEKKTADAAQPASEKPHVAVAMSADGWQVAVADDAGMIHTYSAADGSPIDIQEGHAGAITAMAYGPDGILLSTAADKKAILWNTSSPWTIERTIGHVDKATDLVGRVTALDFSRDGKLLATGSGEPSRSGQVRIWNVADGKMVGDIKDVHSDCVLSLEFSPDAKHVASCSADRFMKVSELAAGKVVRTFEGHTHHVQGVSWQRNGKLLASCGADGVVKVWEFKSGDQKKTIKSVGKDVTSLNFIGDGEQFMVSTSDKTVRTYRANAGNQVRSFAGATDYVYATASSDDGKLVAAGGQDGTLRVWKAADGKAVQTFAPPKPPKTDAKVAKSK